MKKLVLFLIFGSFVFITGFDCKFDISDDGNGGKETYKVYYNVDERIFINNVERKVAGSVEEDDIKSIEEQENAYWGGGTYPITVNAFYQPRLTKIIRIEQCVHGDECANNGAIFALSRGNKDFIPSYQLFKTDLNQYYVVDPENPSNNPVQVEENISENSLQVIVGGSYDNGEIQDIHNLYMVYIKDGKIYKINLERNSDLAPEQVSSEDEIEVVCESKAYTDFLLNESSAYLYKTADSYDECDEDYDWYYVNMRMGIDDDPVKIGEKDIIMPLYDRTSGTIVGWLIRDGEKLRYCDEVFDNCEKVKITADNLDEEDLPMIKYIGSFTYVEEGKDGGLFNKELFAVKDRLYLFIYNINDTDESVFFEIPSYKFKYDYQNIVSHQDGNVIYFTDGGRIVKIEVREIEEKQTVKIIAEEGALRIKDFVITDERVVYVATLHDEELGELDAMYSVTKDGDNKEVLIPFAGDRARRISIITAVPKDDDFGDEIALGVVPLDVVNHEILFGFGKKQIGAGFNEDGKGDVFFLDLDTEDSLFRITDTPAVDERAVRIRKIPFLTN